MRFSPFKRVNTPTKQLRVLQEELEPQLHSDATFTKLWFWNEDTLVLDFRTSYGAKYGIDLELNANLAALNVVGRDDPSRYCVRTRLKSMTKPIRGTQKRQVKTWPCSMSSRKLIVELSASINRVCALMSHEIAVPSRSVPAYWWDEKSNFGDQITPWLIEMMTGRPVYNTIGLPRADQAVMAAGSIITGMNRKNMTVWGSGLIEPLDDLRIDVLKHRSPHRITAVRGERTREELATKLGWDVPAIFGDPALLLPHYFSPHSRADSSKLPALVPHYAHLALLPKNSEESGFETIDVRKPPEIVVAQIANASSIVSTSLHGLIIAQAYGIPWTWLRITDQGLVGEDFKFKDFFSTIDESQVSFVETTRAETPDVNVLDMAAQATLPRSRFSTEALIDAFPMDLVPFMPGDYTSTVLTRD